MSMANTELASITLAYWEVSYCYNRSGESGYKGKRITTSWGLDIIKDSLEFLNPDRPLAKRLVNLHVEIVRGNPTKEKAQA